MVVKPGNGSWRGCGVSVLKDTQNLTRRGLEQPVLVDPTLSREVGLDKSPEISSCFNYSMTLMSKKNYKF